MHLIKTDAFERLAKQVLAHPVVAVIDLEATCFDTPQESARYTGEVIEVGWVKYHTQTGDITDKRSFYVRPLRTPVTPFCTELTGIRPETVANAPTFIETMSQLADWHAQHGITFWLSHGAYDKNKLISQSAFERCAYPFEDHQWMNLKTLARHRLQRKNQLGLMSLLYDLNLPPAGRLHSGVDDAYNAARILHALLTLS